MYRGQKENTWEQLVDKKETGSDLRGTVVYRGQQEATGSNGGVTEGQRE